MSATVAVLGKGFGELPNNEVEIMNAFPKGSRLKGYEPTEDGIRSSEIYPLDQNSFFQVKGQTATKWTEQIDRNLKVSHGPLPYAMTILNGHKPDQDILESLIALDAEGKPRKVLFFFRQLSPQEKLEEAFLASYRTTTAHSFYYYAGPVRAHGETHKVCAAVVSIESSGFLALKVSRNGKTVLEQYNVGYLDTHDEAQLDQWRSDYNLKTLHFDPTKVRRVPSPGLRPQSKLEMLFSAR